MNNPNPLITEPNMEERLISLAIKAAAIAITLIILSVVGCSMHSNAYEPDVKSAEAKIKIEEAKMAESKYAASIEEVKAMERMIQNGANPIAVRCMKEGWSRDTSGTCLAIGVALGKISSSEI